MRRTTCPTCCSVGGTGNGYDLSINRYKEVVHEDTEHLPPQEILKKLAVLEDEIASGMKVLEDMLSQETQEQTTID